MITKPVGMGGSWRTEATGYGYLYPQGSVEGIKY